MFFFKTSDVISTFSKCSGESNCIEEGAMAFHGGGSISSTSSVNANIVPPSLSSVDGAEAGRAAAVATLTRIICAKTTNEVLRESQLCEFLAVVHQSLINKERLVLCSLLFYGHCVYRLALPGMESLLPPFLDALDTVLTESAKLRLHPSFDEIEMRRACLRGLSTVVSWPTTFGASPIPQLSIAGSTSKTPSLSYLQLRLRIYKTLIASLRNETDSINLQLTLAMCTILCEEAAAFDVSMSEEEKKDLMGGGTANGGSAPEKAQCASLVRGFISAVCDRLSRREWSGDFAVCLAALDALNALSTLNSAILFTNKDLSTGMLIVCSLCRFVETQLGKPPPCHSRDLHSSVVGAYQSLVVWLTAAPQLAECESVLGNVAETIQLGITGHKKTESTGERKAASKRVFDAAESLMYSLFLLVGRSNGSSMVDERRLLYLFGPSAIDTTKFEHFLVNNDSILSIHEASHIPNLAQGCACVVYVRRSPMHVASVGYARLKPYLLDEDEKKKKKDNELLSAAVSPCAAPVVAPPAQPALPPPPPPTHNKGALTFEAMEKARQFHLPTDFNTVHCKVDSFYRPLESTRDSEQMLVDLQKAARREEFPRPENVTRKASIDNRLPLPKQASKMCNSVRVFLYDLGLISEKSFGNELVPLDAGQSADFYRDLHEMVDSSPSVTLSTTHVFYVRDGQRSPLDILENGMNLQSLNASFLLLLSSLGDGVDVGVHEGWTGNWATAFSSERKPIEEKEGMDHYVLDGVTHVVWRAEQGTEMAFVMPTLRAVNHFKQDMPPYRHTHRGNSSDSLVSARDNKHDESDDVFVPSSSSTKPYSGGGSSMGGTAPARRSVSDLRVVLVWLERLEDAATFPIEDLVCTCDEGAERVRGTVPPSLPSTERGTVPPPLPSTATAPSSTQNASGNSPGAKSQASTAGGGTQSPHIGIFLHELEPGLVEVRIRGSPMRFGWVGPLMDGVVVSTACLPSLLRHTLLNLSRRSVAEVENFQHTHVKRRQAIADFAKKYAAHTQYEDFLIKLLGTQTF